MNGDVALFRGSVPLQCVSNSNNVEQVRGTTRDDAIEIKHDGSIQEKIQTRGIKRYYIEGMNRKKTQGKTQSGRGI